MKTKVVSLVLILLMFQWFCKVLSAQTTHWLNPLPAGNDFYDIAFFDGQHGLMCGQYGMICATNDGGGHWEIVFNEGSSSLSQINIVAPGHAFIKMGSRQLISTHDYGRVWAKVCQFPDSLSIKRLQMLDASNGYALLVHATTKKTLLGQTFDEGKNWGIDYTDNILNDTATVLDLVFEDMAIGVFLTAENKRYYRTSDSCHSFEYKNYEDDENLYSLASQGNGIFYALGKKFLVDYDKEGKGYSSTITAFIIERSIDFGVNWEEVYLSENFPALRNMKTFGDSVVFAYGYCNDPGGCPLSLIKSSNAGKDWINIQAIPSLNNIGYMQPNVKGFGILDSKKAFCSITSEHMELDWGHVSAVLECDEGNICKPLENNIIERVEDLEFQNNQMYVLLPKVLIKYAPPGRVWDTVSNESLSNLALKSFAVNETKICILGQSSYSDLRLAYTGDLGNNWCFVDLNIGIDYFYSPVVRFFPSNKVYFYQAYNFDLGINPVLFGFNPVDTSYFEITLPNVSANTLLDMLLREEAFYIFGGSNGGNGGYHKSTDEGQSWEFVNLGLEKIMRGFLIDNSLLYVTQGFTYNEKALPAVWSVDVNTDQLIEKVFSAETGMIMDIVETNNDNQYLLMAIAEESYIYKRTDGTYWERFGPYPYFQSLKLDPDGQHVWAYGKSGRMMYMGEEMPVGLEPEQKRAEGMALRSNPVGHALEIDLNLQYSGDAMLSLYDLSGKTMMQHRLKLNGSPKGYNFNVGHLKPGMYILNLEYGGQRISEKVVKK